MLLYNNILLVYNDGLNSGSGGTISSGVALNDGVWHHVAFSFQNGVNNGFKLYVDGVLKTTATASFPTTAQSVAIGSGGSTPQQYFNGSIDEVRIWNIALTDAQIAAYYKVRVSPTTTGLFGNWYMDEGTGSTLNNAVSGGPAFTLYGSPTFSSTVVAPISEYQIQDPANTVTTSSWNFYALTCEGTTAKLYKNGNLVVSTITDYTGSVVPVQIGAYDSTNFLNGYLDNIRIYFNALTQAQIQAIYNYELAVPNQYYNEAIPVTITNNNFTSSIAQGGIGSTTQNGWTFSCSVANSSISIVPNINGYFETNWTFPSQYAYSVFIQFQSSVGTTSMSQSVTFPKDGTYVLTLWAAPRGQGPDTVSVYNGIQTLSAFIDSTQVITDWKGVGSSTGSGVAASLLTSSAFTVTAGTHTLRIQSYSGATNTTDTTIVVTGININNINSTKYLPYISNGLTNYYSFDSGITVANYASGNAVSDITLYGGAVISSSVFKVGSGSLYMNAANSQYAQIASSAINITTNGVSFTCWFNYSSGGWSRLFDFGNGPTTGNILYSPTNGLSLHNGITIVQPGGGGYADSKWHHFCWTIAFSSLTTNTNTWKLYIDGTVVYTTTAGNYPNIITRTQNYIGKSGYADYGDPYATGYVDDFRIYNRVISSSEVLSLIASQKQSNTSIIDNLIPGKKPWGIYDATMWNSTTNTLPEARGNGRDVTRPAGTVTYGNGSGNGAAASVPYISGTTATQLLWPSGSIPTNFTICSITRYTGGTNERILISNTNNWLHGHVSGMRGKAYYEGWKTLDNQSIGTLTNWLVMCGNNGNPTPKNILVDSVASGVNSGGTGGYTLTINNGSYSEPSDWAFTYLVIYDTVLTDAEMYTVSNMLLSYLASGTMGDQLLPATPQAFSSNTLTVTNALNSLQNGTYIASASSYAVVGTEAWRIFYGALDIWHCAYNGVSVGSTYTQQPYSTSGVYQGGGSGLVTYSTTIQSVGSIGGEWVQIKLPYKLQLSTYTLYPPQGAGANWATRYPTIYYIVGSTDGTTWYQIDYQTLSSAPTNTTGPITYTINTLSRYMYFRLITNAVNQGGYVIHYGEWTLTGNVSTS
jgi:hypothetical protein